MEKAYLLTIHYINNYGSVLQTFASQKYFDLHGYNCSVINYTRENATREGVYKEFFQIYRNCKDVRAFKPLAFLLAKRAEIRFVNKSRLFDNFRSEYINLTKRVNKEQLYSDFDEDALFIVGSDQTWNYEYNGGLLPEYYLSFVKKGEKISFASSIGKEYFECSEVEDVKQLLSSFRFITVRENSAVEALKEIGIDNSIHILDPTLLLTKKDWIENLKLKETESDYILLYQLNHNNALVEFARQLSVLTGLRIIRIHTFDFKDRINDLRNVSPESFCQLFLCARYIITDSFHGTAFSINFNKDFFAFQPPKYSTRIKSILELCKLEDRLVTKPGLVSSYFDMKINYEEVKKILQKERQKVQDLMDSLAGEENNG